MSFDDPTGLPDAFAASLRDHDVDALVAMDETGAIQLQDDGSVSDDRERLRSLFEGLVAGPAMPDVDQRLAIVADDIALTSTSYVFEGPQGTTTMTTAEVSRRQDDGRWLVVIDSPGFVVRHG